MEILNKIKNKLCKFICKNEPIQLDIIRTEKKVNTLKARYRISIDEYMFLKENTNYDYEYMIKDRLKNELLKNLEIKVSKINDDRNFFVEFETELQIVEG